MSKFITTITRREPDDKISVGEHVSTITKIEDGEHIGGKGCVRIVFQTAEGVVGGVYNLNKRRLTALIDACGIAAEEQSKLDLEALIGRKCAVTWGLNSKGYPIPMTHAPAVGKPSFRMLTAAEWIKLGCDSEGHAGAATR